MRMSRAPTDVSCAVRKRVAAARRGLVVLEGSMEQLLPVPAVLLRRMAVEHPGEDDPDQVHAGLDSEAEDGPVESGLQQWADQPVARRVGVQIHRHVEFRGRRPRLRTVSVMA